MKRIAEIIGILILLSVLILAGILAIKELGSAIFGVSLSKWDAFQVFLAIEALALALGLLIKRKG
jgi:hypothetical protein